MVLGLARQGWEALSFFAGQGAYITACDRSAVSTAPLIDVTEVNRVRFCLGSQHIGLLQGQQLLCVSAGVPRELPIIQAAVSSGIPVVNDSLLTLARSKAQKAIVTGSNGKTTTTILAGALLKAGAKPGQRVWVGGNVGVPLLQRADAMSSQDQLLWEASSYQLELFDSTSNPMLRESQVDAAVFLNLTPNHLDRHAGMASYASAKLRVLDAIRKEGLLVLNQDDPACRLLLDLTSPTPFQFPDAEDCTRLLREGRERLRAKRVTLIPISTTENLPKGASFHAGVLQFDGVPIVFASELKLRGRHNLTNVLAACALAASMGTKVEEMGQVLRTFPGVPHRLEEVARGNGIVWINDSIATSPERAVAGMRSCFSATSSLILLAGGYDKGLPWQEFAATVSCCVRHLILFGEAGPAIARAVAASEGKKNAEKLDVRVERNLENAVRKAAQLAKPYSTVLLSPGAASFDEYSDFEARGQHFKELALEVNQV